MKRIFLCAALGVLAGAMGTRGEPKPGSPTNPYLIPDTINVTANRSAVPIRETASAITVITSREIAQSQASTVAELLRTVPSVDITQSGGAGGVTSAFIRGANSNQTLVFIDGVKVNDPSSANGGVDFAHMQLDNVERIEILRGPQSVLYGSDAIGGVIQIFTRQGFGKPRVDLTSESGEYDTYHHAATVTGSTGRVGYSGSFARETVKGFSATAMDEGPLEADGYRNSTSSGQVNVRLDSRSLVSVAGRYVDASCDLDQSSGHWDDPNYISKIKTGTVAGQWKWGTDSTRWNHQAGVHYLSSRISARDDTDRYHPQDWIRSWSKGTRLKFDWQSSYAFTKWQKLSLGAETEEERYSSDYQSGSAWGPYSNAVAGDHARTTAMYGLQNVTIGKVLFSTAGVRLDHHERTGNIVTFRVTSAVIVDKLGMKFKGAAGTGEKEPSLNQLLDPMYGNVDLKPEKSGGVEVGAEKWFLREKLTFGATYYYNAVRDLIQYSGSRMENVARAATSGWEGSAEYKSDIVSVKAEYSYTHAYDRRDNSSLIRRPKHKGQFAVIAHPVKPLTARVQVLYVGKREDQDFSVYPVQRVNLPAYTLVGVGATYDLSSIVHLSGRVENLFDRKYQEIYGYGTSGRAVHVGLGLTVRSL